jgi:hypothetical protein
VPTALQCRRWANGPSTGPPANVPTAQVTRRADVCADGYGCTNSQLGCANGKVPTEPYADGRPPVACSVLK